MVNLNAVTLDEFLSTITPAERELLHAHRDPTGLVDQIRAATADSLSLHRAATGARRIRATPPEGIPDWLRLAMLDTFIKWTTGKAQVCTHMPDPRRPQPVYASAWTPNTITCVQCVHLLRVTGVKDRTCDCCGRITSGDEDTDPIYALTVWLGPLCYFAGACTDCTPRGD
jgi:hypothetical protein